MQPLVPGYLGAHNSRLPEVCDMCGICGTVAFSGLADTEAPGCGCEAMLRSLSHRGPDAVGHVATASAVLGVTRLTIRGLEAANQPMVDTETGVVAVATGRWIITTNCAAGWRSGAARSAMKRTWR